MRTTPLAAAVTALAVAASMFAAQADPTAAVSPVVAAPPEHPDPRALPVPYEGAPWYLESTPGPNGQPRNGVVGTPVSDYGSHFGVKASLWEHRPLYLANYATVPGLSGKLDRSVVDILGADGDPVTLRRNVTFRPWGWRERLVGRGVTATGVVTTLDTNAFLTSLRIEATRPVRVRLRVYADDNTNQVHEGSNPMLPGAATADFDAERGELMVRRLFGDQTFDSALASQAASYRAYRVSFPVASTSFSPGASTYSFAVVSDPIRGSQRLSVTLGVGRSEAAARDRVEDGLVRQDPGAAAAVRAVRADWARFFAATPRLPGGATQKERRLYRLANAALRMNLMAPRGRMTGWGSVPSKAHFNLFFGWDTPLQALGYAEWGRWRPDWIDQSRYSLAQQMILMQLDNALPTGQVCLVHDDLGTCPLPMTQPPVQGWAAYEVARRDPRPARAERFLGAAYDGLADYYDFWFRLYDGDADRLPEYRIGLEYGWDDTPRYSGFDHDEMASFVLPTAVEPVDLASWLAMYAGSMARIADRLDRPAAAREWRAEARGMVRRIESALWDPARGGWMDRRAGQVMDVRTPAMWWPVFAGAYDHPQRAERVVTRHLLDPEAFFGRYPIPSVAYDDPLYDAEQGGYYWQGQIWWVPAYASLVALHRTGHEAKARVLLDRLVDMMAGDGGIYENYDALTGEVGWGATGGPGVEPSAFQFGWSSALLVEALLGRYRRVPPAVTR